MERETIKVVRKFRDDYKLIVADPKFPLRSLSQLITLATVKWHEEYVRADEKEKQILIEQMKILQKHCEENGFLHHSREIGNNETE